MSELVSIVTPAYNAERFLRATLDSVLAQTYADWELLLVDDCSTDSTPAIIREYALRDSRVRPMRTAVNTGIPSEVRNAGIRAAQGRYIAFLDADDIWLPSKLEDQVACLRRHGCGAVYSNYEKMDEAGRRSGRVVINPPRTTYSKLLGGNVILQSSGMIDTVRVGKPTFIPVHHEDFKFWLDVLKRIPEARNTNCVHVYYRQRFWSLSGNKIRAMKWTWDIYRRAERLGWIESLGYFCHYLCYAGKKFLK